MPARVPAADRRGAERLEQPGWPHNCHRTWRRQPTAGRTGGTCCQRRAAQPGRVAAPWARPAVARPGPWARPGLLRQRPGWPRSCRRRRRPALPLCRTGHRLHRQPTARSVLQETRPDRLAQRDKLAQRALGPAQVPGSDRSRSCHNKLNRAGSNGHTVGSSWIDLLKVVNDCRNLDSAWCVQLRV